MRSDLVITLCPRTSYMSATHGVLLICPLKIKKRKNNPCCCVCETALLCADWRGFYFSRLKTLPSSAVHPAQLNTWNSSWGQTAASNKNQTVVNLQSILETLKGSILWGKNMLAINLTCLLLLLFVWLFRMRVLNLTVVGNQPFVKSQKVLTPTPPGWRQQSQWGVCSHCRDWQTRCFLVCLFFGPFSNLDSTRP